MGQMSKISKNNTAISRNADRQRLGSAMGEKQMHEDAIRLAITRGRWLTVMYDGCKPIEYGPHYSYKGN
jgi:hypothetical protein